MEETTRALIIVDVQPTFCEGGALAVEGGNVVAEKIADFVQDNLDEYALIVTTQDWHINPGSHFSDTPDFMDTWPPHGIAGTPEAELHEAIASLPIDVEVKKGEYAAAYSGFEGTIGGDDGGEGLGAWLDAHDVDHVDAREQLLDERLGNGHPRIVPSRGHPAVPRGHWPAAPGPQPRRWKVSVKATPSRVLWALIVPPILAM